MTELTERGRVVVDEEPLFNSNHFMREIIKYIIVFQVVSCSHPQQQFETHLQGLRCDEAAAALPSNDPLVKSSQGVKYLAKNVLAYSYITASYTTEVLWDISSGTVLFVGLCGPSLVVSMAARGHGTSGLSCIPLDKNAAKKIMAPPLGRAARHQTQQFRCPDLSVVSESLQKVAHCYEKKADPISLQKAIQSLENIEMSKNFFSCLDPAEQLAIQSYREDLQKKLSP